MATKSKVTPTASPVPGTIGVSGVDMDDLDSLLASLDTAPAPEQVPAPLPVLMEVPGTFASATAVQDDIFNTTPKTKAKSKVAPTMSVGTDDMGFTSVSASLAPVSDPFLDSIEDIKDKPTWLNIVVYGRTGTGKSTFAGQGEKTLVLETEPDGTFSVASSGSITLKGKKKRIRSWSDIEATYWWLKKNPGVFDTVVFDTVSRMVEVCTKSVLIDKETDDFTLTNKDVWKVSLAQRGDVAQRMIFWMEAFRELPIHKVWLAQETTGSGEEAGVGDYSTYPDMQKKPRSFLLGDATIVGRMEIRMKTQTDGSELPVYCLVVGADSTVYTKDRTNALGKGMVNPTVAKILTKVYGTKGA